jgi:hypothetical protein
LKKYDIAGNVLFARRVERLRLCRIRLDSFSDGKTRRNNRTRLFETNYGVNYNLFIFVTVAVLALVITLLNLNLAFKPRRALIRILFVMPALLVRVNDILKSCGLISLTDLSFIKPFLAVIITAV